MEIVVRHIRACSHVALAISRTRQALDRLSIDANIESVLVQTLADAERMSFGGSPTILIDGKDPFPSSNEPAIACRMYATEGGFEGAPSVEQIMVALGGNQR